MRIATTKMLSGDISYSYLGEAMLTTPVLLRNVVRDRWANQVPILNLFMEMGLSAQEEPVNGHAVKWPVFGSTYPPMTIKSVTSATPAVNVEAEITIRNGGWMRNGAVLRLSSGADNIQLIGDGRRDGIFATFRFKYIGNNTTATVPAGLLVAGQRVQFIAGVYGEGSETGHPIRFGTPDMYTNVSTIIRTKSGITGSAMVAPQVEYLTVSSEDGVDVDPYTGEQYNFNMALPLLYKGNKPVVLAHLQAVEKYLMTGIGNFNPLTGLVANTDDRDEVVQMGDGFDAQLKDIAKTSTYSMREPIAQFAARLAAMIIYVGNYVGQQDVEIIAVGGKLFKARLSEAIKYLNKASNITLYQQVAPAGTVSGGYSTEIFKTEWGSVRWVWNAHADDPDSPTQRVNYGGTAFPLESGNAYFMFKAPNASKPNIRIYDVAGTFQGQPINRGFVYNTIPGMTGLGQAYVRGTELAANVAKGMVPTGRDGQQDEVLSEKILIVDNPAQFGRFIATA